MERFLDFQFGKEKKLWPLFFNQSLRAMAISLLSLFSSVYIYRTFTSLMAVFVFFLLLYIFKLFSNLWAEELALRWGLKKQVYFGLLLLVFSLFALLFSSNWPSLLFLAAPFWGMAAGFYWFGRHGLMVKIGHNGAFGQEVGMASALVTFLLLLVPFLGGVLVSLAGYRALFGGALIAVLLSALVLKKVEEKRTHYDTNLAEVLYLFKTHKRMFLAYLGDSAGTTVYQVVLPLYLFLLLKKELSLGGFFSLSMILVALINLVIGRWVDVKGKEKLLGFGAVASFLVWGGRFLTKEIGTLLVFDVFDRITAGMTGIPLNVLTYEKALDGHATGRAVLFRELALVSGSLLVCLLLVFLGWWGVGLRFSFLFAGLFSLLPLLVAKRLKKDAES